MQKVHIQSEGQGKPIILIHGFCENNHLWDEIAPTLAQKHCIMRAEMPGFGTSALDGEVGRVSLEIMAERLYFTLTEEGIHKCTLIGHSMGGYLTLAFAEKYPEMLDGFGLFHSTAYADSDEKKENRLKQAGFVRNNGTEAFVKTLVPSLFAASQDRKVLIENALERTTKSDPESIINALHAMRNRPERLAVLKNAQVPVLMVAGEEDTLIPAEKISYQSSLPARSQFSLLTKSGHMGMVEDPDEAIKAIETFMGLVYNPTGVSV